MSNIETLIPLERIEGKIYVIRGERVMMDSDLAEIYGVETKMFTRAVRRNINRFPVDFMLQLTFDEYEDMRRQYGAAYRDDQVQKSKRNIRYLPLAFTEHGAMIGARQLKDSELRTRNSEPVRGYCRPTNQKAASVLSKQPKRRNRYEDSPFSIPPRSEDLGLLGLGT